MSFWEAGILPLNYARSSPSRIRFEIPTSKSPAWNAVSCVGPVLHNCRLADIVPLSRDFGCTGLPVAEPRVAAIGRSLRLFKFAIACRLDRDHNRVHKGRGALTRSPRRNLLPLRQWDRSAPRPPAHLLESAVGIRPRNCRPCGAPPLRGTVRSSIPLPRRCALNHFAASTPHRPRLVHDSPGATRQREGR